MLKVWLLTSSVYFYSKDLQVKGVFKTKDAAMSYAGKDCSKPLVWHDVTDILQEAHTMLPSGLDMTYHVFSEEVQE